MSFLLPLIANKTIKEAPPDYESLFYCSLALGIILYCIGVLAGSKATKDSSHE